jgi:hypothetical protein
MAMPYDMTRYNATSCRIIVDQESMSQDRGCKVPIQEHENQIHWRAQTSSTRGYKCNQLVQIVVPLNDTVNLTDTLPMLVRWP